MKVIGHRGACGLALENTLASLEIACLLGVDAIEFDIRKTKDNELVLCHDADLDRIAGRPEKIADLSLSELQTMVLSDGHSTVPTLRQALTLVKEMPVIIEIKAHDCLPGLFEILDEFPLVNATVASFKHDEIIKAKELRPDLRVYLAEQTQPVEIIHLARDIRADGIDLNFWLLNPLIYWLAKRQGLDIMVYTVNYKWLASFIGILYPKVAICTNHPEWFVKLPHHKQRALKRLHAKKSLPKES
jgi:glycerophosphoryl diester phosphodiesterase